MIRRFFLLAATALLLGPAAWAAEVPGPAALLRDPEAYVGQLIAIRSVPCADVSAGFLCVLRVGSSSLRIEAGALGARTSTEIAERLIERCKGEVALQRSDCRFDIEVRPRAGQSEQMRREYGQEGAQLYSGEIEMELPARR